MIKFNKTTLKYEVIYKGRVIAETSNKADAKAILKQKQEFNK